MANVRDLNRKIASLQNMQKVMRAMNMIASTKFKKMSSLQNPLEIFKQTVEEIEATVIASFKDEGYYFVDGYENTNTLHVVMFTADRGLCGSHNSTVTKAVDVLCEKGIAKSIPCEITAIGRKAFSYCRKKKLKIYYNSEISEKIFTDQILHEVSDEIFRRFSKGKVQEVYVVYNEFVSTLKQKTNVVKILPLSLSTYDNFKKTKLDTEPSSVEFLKQSAKVLLYYRLKIALLNSYLSEHASRMTAMDNATTNAEDLIFRYGKMRNRARQTTITNELIEIVAGKEALK